jgi:RNA polymerase sigma factor (sigma-70 family)
LLPSRALMDPTCALDDLATRAARGDAAAFEEISFLFSRRLAAFFRMLALDEARAEELAQDTLARAYAKLSLYEPRGTFEAWLFAVGRNLAIDELRRSRRRRDRAAGEATESFVDGGRRGGPAYPGPAERLERAETIALVRGALRDVPPIYRETLVLADLDEVPYERIAARLGTSVGTVKSRVFRGRAALATVLSRRPADL